MKWCLAVTNLGRSSDIFIYKIGGSSDIFNRDQLPILPSSSYFIEYDLQLVKCERLEVRLRCVNLIVLKLQIILKSLYKFIFIYYCEYAPRTRN